MNDEQKGELGFALNKQIADNELHRRKLLGENIHLLKKIKEEGLHKTILGDETCEWVAYLGSLEVFYSRHEVYNWFRVYDKFITELQYDFQTIADIPLSRLIQLLGVVTKENVEFVLQNARILTRKDFTDSIKELRGLPTTDTCTHEYVEYTICSQCGEKHRKDMHYEETK